MNKDTTPSGAAIQRYKIGYRADEWGQRSSTPSGIPDASGSWVRYADHVTALAAGQATAAQQGAYAALPESFLEIPDVQDESGINAYYSREVVLECIDAALASHGQAPAGAGVPTEQQILEAAFAPAQPAAEASRFGSPELQAMIIARCVEKDQADSVTAPAPPPECETEAEKRAFAFGWFKALESERMKADNKKKDPL